MGMLRWVERERWGGWVRCLIVEDVVESQVCMNMLVGVIHGEEAPCVPRRSIYQGVNGWLLVSKTSHEAEARVCGNVSMVNSDGANTRDYRTRTIRQDGIHIDHTICVMVAGDRFMIRAPCRHSSFYLGSDVLLGK